MSSALYHGVFRKLIVALVKRTALPLVGWRPCAPTPGLFCVRAFSRVATAQQAGFSQYWSACDIWTLPSLRRTSPRNPFVYPEHGEPSATSRAAKMPSPAMCWQAGPAFEGCGCQRETRPIRYCESRRGEVKVLERTE